MTPASPVVPKIHLERKRSMSRRMSEAEFDEYIKTLDETAWVEWVDGEVIMAPPASAKHVRLVRFTLTVLTVFVESHENLGEVLGPEMQIRHPNLSRRRVPDLLFIAQSRLGIIQHAYVDGAPDLAVEIVSPDSVVRDWRDKYLEYEAAGVREYWVIDPTSEKVEAYTLNAQQRYERIPAKKGAIHSTVLKGFYLKPKWLWQDPLPNPLHILRELGVE
jgi:Uma2 family endonuclease